MRILFVPAIEVPALKYAFTFARQDLEDKLSIIPPKQIIFLMVQHFIRNADVTFSRKIKELLLIISETAPFIPNIKKISEKKGINRNTLISYMQYLREADSIDDEVLIEAGSKNNPAKQISGWPEDKAFIAADGTEYGYANKVPLWLFGFLY